MIQKKQKKKIIKELFSEKNTTNNDNDIKRILDKGEPSRAMSTIAEPIQKKDCGMEEKCSKLRKG